MKSLQYLQEQKRSLVLLEMEMTKRTEKDSIEKLFTSRRLTICTKLLYILWLRKFTHVLILIRMDTEFLKFATTNKAVGQYQVPKIKI